MVRICWQVVSTWTAVGFHWMYRHCRHGLYQTQKCTAQADKDSLSQSNLFHISTSSMLSFHFIKIFTAFSTSYTKGLLQQNPKKILVCWCMTVILSRFPENNKRQTMWRINYHKTIITKSILSSFLIICEHGYGNFLELRTSFYKTPFKTSPASQIDYSVNLRHSMKPRYDLQIHVMPAQRHVLSLRTARLLHSS